MTPLASEQDDMKTLQAVASKQAAQEIKQMVSPYLVTS
jgi:hypothetical protein